MKAAHGGVGLEVEVIDIPMTEDHLIRILFQHMVKMILIVKRNLQVVVLVEVILALVEVVLALVEVVLVMRDH